MKAAEAEISHLLFATGLQWTAPPNWPAAPADWTPTSAWRPEPEWGPPPPGWAFLRMTDCAADANLPLEYREPEVDEKFRGHIADDRVPATALATFLGSVVEIVSAAFRVTGAAGQAGSDYRDAALRSVRDATQVLDRAARAGRGAPFVFFACAQDALSAVRMFAAAADRSPDDGHKTAGIAALAGAGPAEEISPAEEIGPAGGISTAERVDRADRVGPTEPARGEPPTGERLRYLFQTTSDRVMSLMGEATRQARAPGRPGRHARRALGEIAEITRLVSRVDEQDWMNFADGLKVVDELESVGRRVATAIGVRY